MLIVLYTIRFKTIYIKPNQTTNNTNAFFLMSKELIKKKI